MIRQFFINNLQRSLMLVVVLAAVAVAGSALGPSPVAAQYAETGTNCEDVGDLSHPTIYPGDSGPAVEHAQCLLNEVWGAGLTVDGVYGPNTQAAVEEVQGGWGVTVDGIIGQCTWYALHADGNGDSIC